MVVGENDGYDTILHKISRYEIRYDIRSQNALPYVMVNSPKLMQRSHWRLRTRSHACKRHQRSLTTFERQWEVHLRLHSSRPSQRICGRRPGTACIWVWPHTGWTTTLVPTTDAWQSRLAPGSHTADFIWRNSATVIWKGLGLKWRSHAAVHGRNTPAIERVQTRGISLKN